MPKDDLTLQKELEDKIFNDYSERLESILNNNINKLKKNTNEEEVLKTLRREKHEYIIGILCKIFAYFGAYREIIDGGVNKNYEDIKDKYLRKYLKGFSKGKDGKNFPRSMTLAEAKRFFSQLCKTMEKNILILLSNKYTLPTKPSDVMHQLACIHAYYYYAQHNPNIPAIIDIKIDYIFMRLLLENNLHVDRVKSLAKYTYRINKSKQNLNRKKIMRKQLVLEEYYKTPNRNQMTLNKIATTIHKKLEEKGISSPSVSTIKRYLKEEELL